MDIQNDNKHALYNRQLWLDNETQFARLLSEIMATQDHLDVAALAEEMDLEEGDVINLFERAEQHWEAAKART